MATVLSHGEMFAVFPTAGGQYHWTAMVSSPKWRAVVSWTTGMTDVIGALQNAVRPRKRAEIRTMACHRYSRVPMW